MSWPAPTGDPVGPTRGVPDAPPPSFGAPPLGSQYGVSTSSTGAGPGVSTSSTSGSSTGGGPGVSSSGVSTSSTSGGSTGGSSIVGGPGASVGDGPSGHGGIQVLGPETSEAARLAPLRAKTGQPVRPWTVWASAVLLFGGAATVIVGLLLAMWQMATPWLEVGPGVFAGNDRFNSATWLTGQFPSEPATAMRVVFAILCCVIAVLVAGTAAVVGYCAFAGYRWTRIGGLVALGVSLLSLLLTPVAAASIGLVALGAAPLWLPATTRFFARWQLIRHPLAAYSPPIDQVFYGPLPRYR